MNILAVDTTGESLSVALQAGRRVYSVHRVFARPHDETLLPAVDRLLRRAKIGLDDLDAVAAASGPGRFTGIRIGMAYAAIAARCAGKPALAVSRFEALAFGRAEKRFCVVIPGFRGEKYHQVFPGGKPLWSAALPAGLPLVEGDPGAARLLGPAAAWLARKRRPRFEPLYLKPAGYERLKK
jgi:tRNA threonylcarbamoyladenosine biosynthesis protein TsaB